MKRFIKEICTIGYSVDFGGSRDVTKSGASEIGKIYKISDIREVGSIGDYGGKCEYSDFNDIILIDNFA
ncbi:unnamed protein product [Protopolystoma xenopodis]|uniref:Uncharacterized protein n=1 Tax=Protopolystoma xenopodis TaxID=117903 RepID=A0A3S5CGW0_9PLAT|nr:unnamed protein product [Protopolystoma xenopodis]